MNVTRKNDKPASLIAGHLLKNVKYGKLYEVIKYSYYTGYLIQDDVGQEIWISKGLMRHFFNATGKI